MSPRNTAQWHRRPTALSAEDSARQSRGASMVGLQTWIDNELSQTFHSWASRSLTVRPLSQRFSFSSPIGNQN